MPKVVAAGGASIPELNTFKRALGIIEKDLPKELRKEHKEIAEWIRILSDSRASVLGGVHRHAMDAIKAVGRTNESAIRLAEGVSHPEVFGAEFGGGKYGAGHPKSMTGDRPGKYGRPFGGYTTQFPKWRGSGKGAGYIIYPTIAEHSDDIVDKYGDVVDRLAHKAFPEGTPNKEQ